MEQTDVALARFLNALADLIVACTPAIKKAIDEELKTK